MTPETPAKNDDTLNRPRLIYLAAAGLFIADRVLKWLVLASGRPSAGGLAEFALFRNRGIAFSIPLDDRIFWPAAAAALVLLLAAFVTLLRRGPRRLAPVIFLMILGACSNLFDRLVYDATIDYFIFFGVSAVNIADAMIIGGAAAAYFRLRSETKPA